MLFFFCKLWYINLAVKNAGVAYRYGVSFPS